MSRIRDLRNIDLNLYNFVSSGLSINGYLILGDHSEPYVISGIYLVDGYPEEIKNIKLPTIAIDQITAFDEPLQLGLGKFRKYSYEIGIYARTDGERDDLSELVRNFFDSTMTIYNYNLVFASGVYQSLGTADFDQIRMIKSYPGDIPAMKHIMKISLVCSFATESGYLL
jgi:hypothetical protein